jgi:RNA-dependent RNA polymerase
MEFKESEIEIIHDITCNEFNFSDGIGMISKEIMDEINLIANTNSCAFQFRMGGAKGVVCFDDRLEGRKICLRPSLIKYPSPLTTFELLNPSEFRYGFLNRQLIMLLNTLGTPSETFLALHHEMLKNIEEDCKNFFLCMRAMNPGNLAMKCLHHLMDRPGEPLALEIKSLLLKRTLRQLRQKQKIFLKKSGCLIGVVDEKNTLDYGECFLQVPEGIVEGKVVVAKNPCLHPGDIRVLNAVNRPELIHLNNVVVFPSRGPRPHTNECSGSDLDGDLYFISWEPRLLPPMTQDPMIYDSIPAIESLEDFDHNTLIDFFETFITNDKLGQIDNLHLALADASPDYANDPSCIRLSELHSIAVDFAKTGNMIQIPKDLQEIQFPDFMEHSGPSYKSWKILGLLYRDVKEIPEFTFPDALKENLVENYEQYLPIARKLVFSYKKDLEILMKRFGVACEVELVIAQPLELTSYFQKKKREDELRDLLNMNSNKLIEKHRLAFQKVASKELASACYFVSHKEVAVRAYPWIIAYEYLIEA